MITLARPHNYLLLVALFGVTFTSGCTVMPQTKFASSEGSQHRYVSSGVSIRNIDSGLIDEFDQREQLQYGSCVITPCPDGWDYRIGPGDVLSIVVFDHPELTIPAGPNRTPAEAGNRVHGDGTIFYPYIGKIDVYGKTVSEIRDSVTSGLKKIIPKPQVDVSVAHFRENNQVYVLGEVKQPGKIALGECKCKRCVCLQRWR